MLLTLLLQLVMVLNQEIILLESSSTPSAVIQADTAPMQQPSQQVFGSTQPQNNSQPVNQNPVNPYSQYPQQNPVPQTDTTVSNMPVPTVTLSIATSSLSSSGEGWNASVVLTYALSVPLDPNTPFTVYYQVGTSTPQIGLQGTLLENSAGTDEFSPDPDENFKNLSGVPFSRLELIPGWNAVTSWTYMGQLQINHIINYPNKPITILATVGSVSQTVTIPSPVITQ